MQKQTVHIFIVLVTIMIVVCSAAPVLAAGLQVRPGKIAIEMEPEGSYNATLLVRNDQSDESHYKIYVKEEEYQNWITFDIDDFSLLSQQSKNVEITITPPSTASGEHKVYIRVRSINPSSGVAIGTGIKVPVHISLSEVMMSTPESTSEDSPITWPLIGGIITIIAVVVATMGIVFWRRYQQA